MTPFVAVAIHVAMRHAGGHLAAVMRWTLSTSADVPPGQLSRPFSGFGPCNRPGGWRRVRSNHPTPPSAIAGGLTALWRAPSTGLARTACASAGTLGSFVESVRHARASPRAPRRVARLTRKRLHRWRAIRSRPGDRCDGSAHCDYPVAFAEMLTSNGDTFTRIHSRTMELT